MFASLSKSLRPLGAVALAVITLGLLMGGCASPSRVPLSAEKRASFSDTKTIIGQTQQEIGADINPSNISAATGGGLIAGLIDAGINNSRAKKAVNAATPVRDALIGYDPGQSLAAALKKELATQPWLKLGQLEVRTASDMKTVNGWINANTSGQLLTITPDYRLTASFQGINLNAFVRLHDAKPKAAGESNSAGDAPALYANTFSVFLPLPGAAADLPAEEAARQWADHDGLKVRTSLDLGFAEIARMIAFDLTAEAPAGKALYKAPEGTKTRVVPIAAGIAAQGYEVTTTTPGRAWIRMPSGQLVSVSQ